MSIINSIVSLGLLVAAGPGVPADRSVTYVDPGERGWFVCDSLDSGVVLLVRRTASNDQVIIRTLRKAAPAAPMLGSYGVGRPDPGAGQVYYELTMSGREIGAIHAFNPGAYDEAAVRTPPVTSVRIGTASHQCRWLANTRMIGIGVRRSFVVREDARGRLIYESFDYAGSPGPILNPDGVQRTTRPSRSVTGGQENHGKDGTIFRFASAGYTYVIVTSANGTATLAVMRGKRLIQRERLIGYTFAPGG